MLLSQTFVKRKNIHGEKQKLKVKLVKSRIK